MKLADALDSYIPEPKRPARKWNGKAEEQKAVYANRRRVKGNYGKRLLKKRGELIERSFAHCYDTGGMRRVYLRGRENVFKRQLIHVGAFNLSLIFRTTLGAGTPRQLRNRRHTSIFVLLSPSRLHGIRSQPCKNNFWRSERNTREIRRPWRPTCRRRISAGCATGCPSGRAGRRPPQARPICARSRRPPTSPPAGAAGPSTRRRP